MLYPPGGLLWKAWRRSTSELDTLADMNQAQAENNSLKKDQHRDAIKPFSKHKYSFPLSYSTTHGIRNTCQLILMFFWRSAKIWTENSRALFLGKMLKISKSSKEDTTQILTFEHTLSKNSIPFTSVSFNFSILLWEETVYPALVSFL